MIISLPTKFWTSSEKVSFIFNYLICTIFTYSFISGYIGVSTSFYEKSVNGCAQFANGFSIFIFFSLMWDIFSNLKLVLKNKYVVSFPSFIDSLVSFQSDKYFWLRHFLSIKPNLLLLYHILLSWVLNIYQDALCVKWRFLLHKKASSNKGNSVVRPGFDYIVRFGGKNINFVFKSILKRK